MSGSLIHPRKPFLLLSTRPETEAASAEVVSFRTKMGLGPDGLVQIRLESRPLGDLDLREYSGVLLGGSPFNASSPIKSPMQTRVEADLAALMEEVLQRDFPLFGACYGVGTVGTAIGAVIDGTYGETPRVIGVSVTGRGARDPLLEGVPERFSTMVGHKEAITVLPDVAEVLVTGENCPVQMFRVQENVYATQFHPELAPEAFEHRLRIYANAGYHDPAELDAILATTRGVDLTVDDAILRNFATRYAR
ncbi:glutamine amidotransferase [Corynebacterium comes]|uniref:GMP synthase [glutamine-hydrolyzing] n=1 Tax=Corynebacterium comes TaxID=2675218 RepID=A0A6B8VWZ8_9CORY|nr:glutamine amidotransferase [Corynebacterium comes]QGU04641.1 GMP synthase [glutamine-hydrolyzing] [Corynebacterium comes]